MRGLLTRRRKRDTRSVEDNKAIARRHWDEVWNTGNVAMVEESFAPDTIFHSAAGTVTRGREARKQGPTRWRTAMPDLRATIEDLFAEGDKVVVRWTIHGTHKGPIEVESAGTFPPTGKPLSFAGMDIYALRGGKIVEVWRYWSSLQVVQQLGVLHS